MAVRTKKVSKTQLQNREERREVWLDIAKRIEDRYRISAKDSRMVAAVAVDWLHDQVADIKEVTL
jgi:hypothetical protein